MVKDSLRYVDFLLQLHMVLFKEGVSDTMALKIKDNTAVIGILYQSLALVSLEQTLLKLTFTYTCIHTDEISDNLTGTMSMYIL